jgi:hypothetical protein
LLVSMGRSCRQFWLRSEYWDLSQFSGILLWGDASWIHWRLCSVVLHRAWRVAKKMVHKNEGSTFLGPQILYVDDLNPFDDSEHWHTWCYKLLWFGPDLRYTCHHQQLRTENHSLPIKRCLLKCPTGCSLHIRFSKLYGELRVVSILGCASQVVNGL